MVLFRNFFISVNTFIFILFLAFNTSADELITNGGFETGDLTGWSRSVECQLDAEDCQQASFGVMDVCWFVGANSGTTAPITGKSISAPPEGDYALVSDSFNSSLGWSVRQKIEVPSSTSIPCFLVYYYKSTVDFVSGQGLGCDDDNDNQTFRIDIMSSGSGAFDTETGVLENLYLATPSDPKNLGYTNLDFNLTKYAGSTVYLRLAAVGNNSNFMVDEISCTSGDLLGGDGITSVPTLSEWGLIAMAGVLGIIGLLAVRRRKAAT